MSFIDTPGSAAGMKLSVGQLSLALLLKLLDQLRSCRRRLEADEDLGTNGYDAITYLVAAEMHMKAAGVRLEAEISKQSQICAVKNGGRKCCGGRDTSSP